MGKRGVCLTAGPLLMVIGGGPLLVLFWFAGIVPPDLKGWEWWSAVLDRFFANFQGASGWLLVLCGTIFLLGLTLLIIGVQTVLGDLIAWLRYSTQRESK